jgi:Nitroreductase
VQNPVLLKRIVAATAKVLAKDGYDALYGAPTLIIISAKRDEFLTEGLAYANAACIAENMLLAATDLGVGSVYLFTVLRGLLADKNLMKYLGLGDELKPVSSVALGYAVEPLVAGDFKKAAMKISVDRFS